MQGLKEAITLFAQSLGLPGLALITFLDSSFLTFPELPDIWLMGLVISNPSEWLWYVARDHGVVDRRLLRAVRTGQARR